MWESRKVIPKLPWISATITQSLPWSMTKRPNLFSIVLKHTKMSWLKIKEISMLPIIQNTHVKSKNNPLGSKDFVLSKMKKIIFWKIKSQGNFFNLEQTSFRNKYSSLVASVHKNPLQLSGNRAPPIAPELASLNPSPRILVVNFLERKKLNVCH